ncbi:hypothetical protein BXO88_00340 [Oribacterium sp. C9]|uniref:SH3 domain-containing protein n=1 Tax=Oribacterium sp. C9 TaxID=1943579 RepID=UPI00099021DA|nr:SH3 domain-containing protein [Oribacterium sp. C9]OON88285.1 hypothetical protein BXO88_00340 [Oribacterium sp. C9]
MPTPREANIWGKIRNDLSQAQQNILNGQYGEALIIDKRILKALVRMQIDRAVLVSNNLENDIDQLFDNQLISSQSRDNYHAIRIYGEQAETGETPTSQAANESFSLIRDELNIYVDSFQSRPAAASYDSAQNRQADTDTVSRNPYDGRYSEPQVPDQPSVSAGYSDLNAVNVPLSSGSSDMRGSGNRRNGRPTRPLRDSERVSRTSGRRSSAQRSGRSGHNPNRRLKRKKGVEWDLYNIMKFLIPISCVILLIILIKIINGGSSKPTIETTQAPTETAVETTQATMETIPETTAVPETPAVSSVWVTTTGVKVRTEPNTNCEVLEVLDAGVQVTYKGSPDDEWIMIDYNGRDAYLNKQFVQEVAQESPAA